MNINFFNNKIKVFVYKVNKETQKSTIDKYIF